MNPHEIALLEVVAAHVRDDKCTLEIPPGVVLQLIQDLRETQARVAFLKTILAECAV